jgi:hypothetical protein
MDVDQMLIFGIRVEMHAEELSGLLRTAPAYIMDNPVGRVINRFSQVSTIRCT